MEDRARTPVSYKHTGFLGNALSVSGKLAMGLAVHCFPFDWTVRKGSRTQSFSSA